MLQTPDTVSTLRDVLTHCRTLAVVGLSPQWHRPSHFAAKYMQAHGYRIIPVNPLVAKEGGEILGEKAYASVTEAAEALHKTGVKIDMVDCFRKSEDIPPLADEAIAIGAKCLWLQLGVFNEPAGLKAEAAGLQVMAAGVAVLAALWFGARAVEAGAIAPRLLAVLVLTPLALHEAMSGLAQAAQTLTRARAALVRVIAVLDEPPVGRGDAPYGTAVPTEEASNSHPSSPSVRATNLAVGWPGHPVVASGLDLSVRPGEALAIIGPSGSGKTTVAATLLGLIPPVSGEVTVIGRVGYLAQDAHIFATSVAENVRIGDKDATAAQVEKALAAAGLSLDPARVVGELGATLSGGEARRLALSRLLVGAPDVLILDEPTEHLDRDTASALMDDIWSRVDERPVIVLTHDPLVVARCSRVLTIGDPAD